MLGVGEFFIIASFLTAFLKRRQKNRRLNKFRMDETLFRYLFQFIIFLDAFCLFTFHFFGAFKCFEKKSHFSFSLSNNFCPPCIWYFFLWFFFNLHYIFSAPYGVMKNRFFTFFEIFNHLYVRWCRPWFSVYISNELVYNCT